MRQYDTFIFDSYAFDPSLRRIELRYGLDDDVRFVETLELPQNLPLDIRDPAALDRALFALHLAGGVSYYKTCLPGTIEIRSGTLAKEQTTFWNTLYLEGLGEFSYVNEIDLQDRIRFPSSNDPEPISPATYNLPPTLSCLVPIGGGKDSMVSIELLKQACIPQTLLRVGDHPVIRALANEANLPLLTVGRRLAPELFTLNAQGALNGHVPITAYLSFLSVVLTAIGGYSHVVFSNERSASEGNTELFGRNINHQWSKSAEAETLIREYLTHFVTPSISYFSLLRPLSELKIAQMFAKHPRYHALATSCNRNWRIVQKQARPAIRSSAPSASLSAQHNRNNASDTRNEGWCTECPKCAFAFVLMAAVLPRTQVEAMFGANLFAREDLLPLYRELLGLEGFKPFECVGTATETQAAFLLAKRGGEWNDDAAMRLFTQDSLPTIRDTDALLASVLQPDPPDTVPEPFASLLPRR